MVRFDSIIVVLVYQSSAAPTNLESLVSVWLSRSACSNRCQLEISPSLQQRTGGDAAGASPNSTLRRLIPVENDIGNAGTSALAKALNKNTALRDLNLSSNGIGDVGLLRRFLRTRDSVEPRHGYYLLRQAWCIGRH
jgi:Leucine Rich repeat